jgi:hypothetical protein
VRRLERIESVFLSIPYHRDFEDLYLAYIVGLTQLGIGIRAALAVQNQGPPRNDYRIDRAIRILYPRFVTRGCLSRRSAVQHARGAGSRPPPIAHNPWASAAGANTACSSSKAGHIEPSAPMVGLVEMG